MKFKILMGIGMLLMLNLAGCQTWHDAEDSISNTLISGHNVMAEKVNGKNED